MKTTSSRRIAVAAAAAAALALAGCSGNSSTAGGATAPPTVKDGAVSMNIAGPVTSYDPAKGSSYQDAEMSWALYDTLVSFDTDGKIIAGLATKWDTTANSATFTLKGGVSCSDGTPLTADDVAASVNRFMDPKTAAPLRSLVIGAGNTGKATASGSTITVSLAKPWNGLLQGLATPFTGIICPSGLADPSKLATASAGSGAWVTDTQVTGSSYTLKPHQGYAWGTAYKDAPKGQGPTSLTLKVVTDESTRANLMSTGDLQIGSYTSDVWSRFKGGSGVSVQTSQMADTVLMFNEAPGHPTADPAVRKAISQAIDRQQFNQIQGGGKGVIMDSLGQSTYPCYSSLASDIPQTDTKAASGALKGVKLNVIGTNVVAGGNNNSYIQSALQAVGANANLKNLDNQAYIGDLFSGTGDWDVTVFILANPLNSLPMMGGYFTGPTPPKGQNLGAVKNTEATDQLTLAGTQTGDAACAATTAFQRALITNSDVLPLATSPATVVFTSSTQGSVVKGFVMPSTIRIGS